MLTLAKAKGIPARAGVTAGSNRRIEIRPSQRRQHPLHSHAAFTPTTLAETADLRDLRSSSWSPRSQRKIVAH
ncbi:MAG: hypothetical protein R2724_16525 [Bryobacterales bacterium]